MFDLFLSTPLEQRDYNHSGVWTTRAPMLALSSPDPALALPHKVQLHPTLFLRNASASPAVVQLQFHWRNNRKDGNYSAPELHLARFETRQVDVKAMQDQGLIPADAYWAQVTFKTNTGPDQIVAVAASYDSTLRYGAQTPFSDQLSDHMEGSEWIVDPTHTTIIATGNASSKPVTLAMTLFYNQGFGQYRIVKEIMPDDQLWVNVADLIRNQIPDVDGKLLPVNLTSGTYQLKTVGTLSTALYEAKVVTDKTYGHATYGCNICCGYSSPYLVEDPTVMGVGATQGVSAYGTDLCAGGSLRISAATLVAGQAPIPRYSPHRSKALQA